MQAILDIVGAVMGIGIPLIGTAYIVWIVGETRRLQRSLRPIARCNLLEAVSLRDLVPQIRAAVQKADDAILAAESTFRQPASAIVLFENDRPRAALLLVVQRADNRSPKHQHRKIDIELRSESGGPLAPPVKPAKRVLDAVDRALRSMSNIEGIRWTRDRNQWHDRPFDS